MSLASRDIRRETPRAISAISAISPCPSSCAVV